MGVIFPHYQAPRLLLNPLSWPKIGLRHELDEGAHTYRATVFRWSNALPSLHENWLQKGEELFAHYVKKHGAPDLIHVNACHRAGILAHRIHEKHKIPYIIIEHQAHYIRSPRPDWVRKEICEAFAAASARVAVSEGYGAKLEELLGECFTPWSYIPNSLGEEFSARSLPATRAEPARSPRLLTIGNLIEHKGQDFLLRSFLRAKGKEKDWTLTLVGDGPLRPKLEEFVNEHGLQDHIFLRGNLPRDEVIKALD